MLLAQHPERFFDLPRREHPIEGEVDEEPVVGRCVGLREPGPYRSCTREVDHDIADNPKSQVRSDPSSSSKRSAALQARRTSPGRLPRPGPDRRGSAPRTGTAPGRGPRRRRERRHRSPRRVGGPSHLEFTGLPANWFTVNHPCAAPVDDLETQLREVSMRTSKIRLIAAAALAVMALAACSSSSKSANSDTTATTAASGGSSSSGATTVALAS